MLGQLSSMQFFSALSKNLIIENQTDVMNVSMAIIDIGNFVNAYKIITAMTL